MRKDVAVFEEADVLPSKLDRSGFSATGWHGVFPWTKKKKESNGE
jgi:hypothetical protein